VLATCGVFGAALTCGAQPRDGDAIPRLVFEAPPELATARVRVESFDTARLRTVVQLIGLDDPGPAIRVVLAAENSGLARQVPQSTAGFAAADESLIVLFPARSPAYPHDTLEDVLRHEVAHVLTARAARGASLPRWFSEGLAMIAERMWSFEDRVRLLMLVSPTPLADVDAIFAGREGSRARAYTVAGAFVRDLTIEHGAHVPAAILAQVGRGMTFERAFVVVTGRSMREAESAFWHRHRLWARLGPFLTTQTALWMIVTLLSALAFVRRRQKRAEQRKRWEHEEPADDSPDS
jgi:hypothetical protein